MGDARADFAENTLAVRLEAALAERHEMAECARRHMAERDTARQECAELRAAAYVALCARDVAWYRERGLCARDVAWYRERGHYPVQRIARDADGVEYVIGDWSWARLYPAWPELVDDRMPSARGCD